jgi:hypothetical protein
MGYGTQASKATLRGFKKTASQQVKFTPSFVGCSCVCPNAKKTLKSFHDSDAFRKRVLRKFLGQQCQQQYSEPLQKCIKISAVINLLKALCPIARASSFVRNGEHLHMTLERTVDNDVRKASKKSAANIGRTLNTKAVWRFDYSFHNLLEFQQIICNQRSVA